MEKAAKKVLTAIAVFVLIMAALMTAFFVHLSRQLAWQVHEPMTGTEQRQLACMALMPSIADILERYAERGLRDSEYLAESRAFGGIGELTAALPAGSEIGIGETLKEGIPERTEDIKGTAVTRYEISWALPQATKEELPSKYEYYTYGCFIHYYLLEYDDGSWRFAAEIVTA